MKTAIDTGNLTLFIQGGTGGIGGGLMSYALKKYKWKKVFISYRDKNRLDKLKDDVADTQNAYEYINVDIESEYSIKNAVQKIAQTCESLDILINAGGFLHDNKFMPEKKLDDVDRESLIKSFSINAVGPLMMVKHFSQLFDKNRESLTVNISAKVGSINDNRLGGWYSYRTAKAALNMITVNTSIELNRKFPKHICIALHPGTTDSRLSEPFQRRVPSSQLSSPLQTAERLWAVIEKLDYLMIIYYA